MAELGKKWETTVLLVQRAKGGDREAWAELVDRYYRVWLDKYHGKLGTVIRKLHDTQDLVQSAIGDAMVDIPRLENEGVFFAWITSIIRHKLARVRGKLKRENQLNGPGDLRGDFPDHGQGMPEEEVSEQEDYLQILEAVIEFFPQHPEEMASVYLKFLEECTVPEMVQRLGRPRRTIYRWLQDGTERLKRRLSP